MPRRDPIQDIIDDEEGLVTEDQAEEIYQQRLRDEAARRLQSVSPSDGEEYDDSEYYDQWDTPNGNARMQRATAARVLRCAPSTLERIIERLCAASEFAFQRHEGNGRVYLIRRDVASIAYEFGANAVDGFEVEATYLEVCSALKLPPG